MLKPNFHFQRFEFKYYIPEHLIEPIKQDLIKNNMKWDPYLKKPNSSYEVRSLYYDSPNLQAYWEKEAGVKKRKKQRIRVYSTKADENPPVFFEIKRKHDNLVLKDRILTKWQNVGKLLLGQENNYFKYFSAGDKNIVEEFFYDFLNKHLKPSVLVVYDRTPLINDYDEKFRVTFDFNIRAARTDDLFYQDYFEPILDNGCIMEVKFNNTLAFWFHSLIQKYELKRISFSKYCHGIYAINSGLDQIYLTQNCLKFNQVDDIHNLF